MIFVILIYKELYVMKNTNEVDFFIKNSKYFKHDWYDKLIKPASALIWKNVYDEIIANDMKLPLFKHIIVENHSSIFSSCTIFKVDSKKNTVNLSWGIKDYAFSRLSNFITIVDYYLIDNETPSLINCSTAGRLGYCVPLYEFETPTKMVPVESSFFSEVKFFIDKDWLNKNCEIEEKLDRIVKLNLDKEDLKKIFLDNVCRYHGIKKCNLKEDDISYYFKFSDCFMYNKIMKCLKREQHLIKTFEYSNNFHKIIINVNQNKFSLIDFDLALEKYYSYPIEDRKIEVYIEYGSKKNRKKEYFFKDKEK